MNIGSLADARFFMEFIDDCSRWYEVRFREVEVGGDQTIRYIGWESKKTPQSRVYNRTMNVGIQEYTNNDLVNYLTVSDNYD